MAPKKVEKYKASKTAYLGHVTRELNKIDVELSEEETNVQTLEELLEKLEAKYAKVEEYSNKIQEETEDVGDIEAEVETMDALLDKVIQMKSRAKAAMKKEIKVEASPTKESPSDVHERRKESIHLPKLEIEKFCGDIEKYKEFMDSFKVTIDKNPRLADVEKLMYLKSYVDKDAADLLEGIARTDANYTFALKLLEDNYGNKEVLINTHVSKLISLEKQGKDGMSLRMLYNKVITHVRELEGLDITSDMYSVFLVPIVTSKINEELRKQWIKRKERGIHKLMNFIYEEVESIESSSYVEQAFKEDVKSQKPNNSYSKEYKRGQQPSYQGFSSAHALSIQTRKKMCVFCPEREDHYPDECLKGNQMSTEERWFIVKQEQACILCLKKGHNVSNCRRLGWLKCRKCQSRSHNTLLHEEYDGSSCEESEDSKKSYEDSKESKCWEDSGGSKKANGLVTACETHTRSNSIILPQAKGRIIGPTGIQMEVNILLDICSDRNFIKEEVAKKIGLQGHTEELSIAGITGKVNESKPRRVVSATLKNRHHLEKSREVEMVEVPEICTPFTRPAVSEKALNSKDLRHLQLADDYTEEKHSTIDVLIGVPTYWSLVSGTVRRSKHHPIAMESIFGWVLVSDSTEDKETSGNVRSNVCQSLYSSISEAKKSNEEKFEVKEALKSQEKMNHVSDQSARKWKVRLDQRTKVNYPLSWGGGRYRGSIRTMHHSHGKYPYKAESLTSPVPPVYRNERRVNLR